MKIAIYIAAFLCCVSTLGTTAYSATYTDDMADMSSDGIKSYSGFKPYIMGGAAPDKTVLTFASFDGQSLSAHANYTVDGAEMVVVSIYSRCGTFVSRDPKDSQVYLGVFKDDMSFFSGQSLQQAWLRPGTNEVYTDLGGWKRMYYTGAAYVFVDSGQPDGLVGYGIRVGYSNNGNSYTDAGLRHTKLQFDTSGSMWCYEQYAASVPAGVKYIRVEINDIASDPLIGGGSVPKGLVASRYTSLASVAISGGNLRMGEPETVVQPPVVGYYIGEGASYSSEETRDTHVAGTAPAEASDEKSSSSKFEGTITSSSKAAREKAPAPDSAEKNAESSRKSSLQSVSSEEPRNEATVFEIRRGEETGFFDSAVTIYIVAVTGALALLVILKKK